MIRGCSCFVDAIMSDSVSTDKEDSFPLKQLPLSWYQENKLHWAGNNRSLRINGKMLIGNGF
jgi:hypothetical protein